MPIIKTIKPERKQISSDEILARFCYLYPQYSFKQAQQMPFVRIQKMITVARQEQARNWYNLLRIQLAPHTKKGAASKLFTEFKNMMEGKL